MVTATSETTTSRRFALRGISATVAGAIGVPAVATAFDDARLIKLCGELTALQGEMDEVFRRRVSIETEAATDPELDRLYNLQADLITVIVRPASLQQFQAS